MNTSVQILGSCVCYKFIFAFCLSTRSSWVWATVRWYNYIKHSRTTVTTFTCTITTCFTTTTSSVSSWTESTASIKSTISIFTVSITPELTTNSYLGGTMSTYTVSNSSNNDTKWTIYISYTKPTDSTSQLWFKFLFNVIK